MVSIPHHYFKARLWAATFGPEVKPILDGLVDSKNYQMSGGWRVPTRALGNIQHRGFGRGVLNVKNRISSRYGYDASLGYLVTGSRKPNNGIGLFYGP